MVLDIKKCGSCSNMSCEKSIRTKEIIAIKEALEELLNSMDSGVYWSNDTSEIKVTLQQEIQKLVA